MQRFSTPLQSICVHLLARPEAPHSRFSGSTIKGPKGLVIDWKLESRKERPVCCSGSGPKIDGCSLMGVGFVPHVPDGASHCRECTCWIIEAMEGKPQDLE